MFIIRILLIVIMIAVWSSLNAQQHQERPNIIIILADDMGYGDVSSYNEDSAFETPNIDQLAENGVKFTQVYTSSAVCTPTRYGLLTGRYNWRSTLKSSVTWGFSEPLISDDRVTIADVLSENNYHTAFIGKWHLGWDWEFTGDPSEDLDDSSIRPQVDFSRPIKNGPNDRGFHYSYGIPASLDMPPYVYVENNQPTTIPTQNTVNYDEKGFWRKGLTGSDFSHVDVLPHLTEQSVQYIYRRADTGQPFFMYFALPAPHTPILPTTEFMGKSNSNMYGDFVLQVDDVVGQIRQALEKHDILEETMIVFTTDNGASPRSDFPELESAGHDPSYIFRGHKADIYEGALRVPFVVSWPDGISGTFESNETISTVDFMATFADMVGAALPDDAGWTGHLVLTKPIIYCTFLP